MNEWIDIDIIYFNWWNVCLLLFSVTPMWRSLWGKRQWTTMKTTSPAHWTPSSESTYRPFELFVCLWLKLSRLPRTRRRYRHVPGRESSPCCITSPVSSQMWWLSKHHVVHAVFGWWTFGLCPTYFFNYFFLMKWLLGSAPTQGVVFCSCTCFFWRWSIPSQLKSVPFCKTDKLRSGLSLHNRNLGRICWINSWKWVFAEPLFVGPWFGRILFNVWRLWSN